MVKCAAADLFRRGIDCGLAQHDVAPIIEVAHDISSEEKENRKANHRADTGKLPAQSVAR
jgi:hypothetical protein